MSLAATCSSICRATGTGTSLPARPFPGEQPRGAPELCAAAPTRPLRNPMNTMTPTRPAGRHACRGHLATGPAGEAGARSQIRAVICAWDAAAAADVAVLLTSELGIN